MCIRDRDYRTDKRTLKVQVKCNYYGTPILHQLWLVGYDGDMHRPSTRIMKTGLKYYISAVGRSSDDVQLMVSGWQRRHSSSNYLAAAACTWAKETSGRTGQLDELLGDDGTRPLCKRNIGIGHQIFFCLKNRNIGHRPLYPNRPNSNLYNTWNILYVIANYFLVYAEKLMCIFLYWGSLLWMIVLLWQPKQKKKKVDKKQSKMDKKQSKESKPSNSKSGSSGDETMIEVLSVKVYQLILCYFA